MGAAVLLRPLPGFRPGGRLPFLGAQERKQRNRPCCMALRVRCVPRRLQAPCPSIGVRQAIGLVFGPISVHQVCRAAPNSLRYAAFRQEARSQFLKSLARRSANLRSSPMQKGNPGKPILRVCQRFVVRRIKKESLRMPISDPKKPTEYSTAELNQTIRLLVAELCTRHNNVAPDTGASLIPSKGKVNVRPTEKGVQLAIECDFGWVIHQFDVQESCGVAAAINGALQTLFVSIAAQAEVASGGAAIQ